MQLDYLKKLYTKKRIFEYINRQLPATFKDITIYDKEVITWIAERTISYGKLEEYISFSDFIEGVYTTKRGELELIHSGLLMSGTKVKKVLRSLEQKEIIIVKRKNNGKNSYSINMLHECFGDNLVKYMSSNDFMIKVSRKQKVERDFIKTPKKKVQTEDFELKITNTSKKDTSPIEYRFGENLEKIGGHVVPGGRHETPSSIYITETNKKTETKTYSSSSRDCELSPNFQKEEVEEIPRKEKLNEEKLLEEIKRKKDILTEKRKEKVSSVRTLSVARVLDVWKDSIAKTDYAMKIDLKITKAEAGRIKIGLLPMLVEYFIETHGSGTIPQYFDWITQNWGLIMRTKFKWMTKEHPPLQPSLIFVTNFKKHFIDAYYTGQELRKFDNGTIAGTLMADLLKKGYSYKEVIENSLLQEAIKRKKYDAEQLFLQAKAEKRKADGVLMKASSEAIEQIVALKRAKWKQVREELIQSAIDEAYRRGDMIKRADLEDIADKTIEELAAELEDIFSKTDF